MLVGHFYLIWEGKIDNRLPYCNVYLDKPFFSQKLYPKCRMNCSQKLSTVLFHAMVKKVTSIFQVSSSIDVRKTYIKFPSFINVRKYIKFHSFVGIFEDWKTFSFYNSYFDFFDVGKHVSNCLLN